MFLTSIELLILIRQKIITEDTIIFYYNPKFKNNGGLEFERLYYFDKELISIYDYNFLNFHYLEDFLHFTFYIITEE